MIIGSNKSDSRGIESVSPEMYLIGGYAVYRTGKAVGFAGVRGGEPIFKSEAGQTSLRISPFGHGKTPNMTKNPLHRRLPHYHRRPGIGKHRPWERR